MVTYMTFSTMNNFVAVSIKHCIVVIQESCTNALAFSHSQQLLLILGPIVGWGEAPYRRPQWLGFNYFNQDRSFGRDFGLNFGGRYSLGNWRKPAHQWFTGEQ